MAIIRSRSDSQQILCLQAGMIRIGGDEFFIEPLKDDEEEDEGVRRHVVYRSSAVIKEPSADDRGSEDYLRGESSTGSVQVRPRMLHGSSNQGVSHSYLANNDVSTINEPIRDQS